MSANTEVLMLLFREIHISGTYGKMSPARILPLDDPLLTAVHAAGVKTTARPSMGELRQVIRHALQAAVR